MAGVVVSAMWYLPLIGTALQESERRTDDVVSQLQAAREPDDLVFLGIDEESLAVADQVGLELDKKVAPLLQQRFPWDRAVYAAAIEKLLAAGAKLVVIDLLLTEPMGDGAGDVALEQVIARHRDRVVLAGALAFPEGRGDVVGVVEPLAEFLGPLEGGTRYGFVNFWGQAQDGVIRQVEYEARLNELLGLAAHEEDEQVFSLAGAMLEALGEPVPAGKLRPQWAAPGSFRPKSVARIFEKKAWEEDFEEGRFFGGKVVMVGPSAARFQDQHAVPGQVLLGPQLHLHLVAAARQGAFFTQADAGKNRPWVLTGSLLAMVLVAWRLRSPLLVLVGTAGAIGVLGLVVIGATEAGWLLPVVPGLTVIGGSYLVLLVGLVLGEQLRRAVVRRHLERSLSPQVAAAVLAAPEGYYNAARGKKRLVAVLFSDVRGFTTWAEEMEPQALVAQLNHYFAEMTEAVFNHGGVLDKFIGDAVMASWGGLGDEPPEVLAQRSVAAALEMRERLAALNEKWTSEGRTPLKIGVGIHLGEAVAGELGSDQRSDFTVLGDAVNLASRIEGFTKQVGTDFLVSADVEKFLAPDVPRARMGDFVLKGKKQAIRLFQPGVTEPPELSKAFGYLETGDLSDAQAHFQLLAQDPRWQKLSTVYLELKEWAGEVHITEK